MGLLSIYKQYNIYQDFAASSILDRNIVDKWLFLAASKWKAQNTMSPSFSKHKLPCSTPLSRQLFSSGDCFNQNMIVSEQLAAIMAVIQESPFLQCILMTFPASFVIILKSITVSCFKNRRNTAVPMNFVTNYGFLNPECSTSVFSLFSFRYNSACSNSSIMSLVFKFTFNVKSPPIVLQHLLIFLQQSRASFKPCKQESSYSPYADGTSQPYRYPTTSSWKVKAGDDLCCEQHACP